MSKAKGYEESPTSDEKLRCGIVMPISAIDGCPEHHWAEVFAILKDAIETAGFEASMVSAADDVGIIQKRIIQNLFDNPIVVCDVSGKNPNVMFELGMRLAFDKPTIIIKDDKTSYSFDTSPIEHVEYPRDLRFTRIVDFKKLLAEKVKATHAKATTDKKYTTFLGHFGKYTVAKLETTEITQADYIVEELKELKRLLLAREPAATRRADAPSQTEINSSKRLEAIRSEVESFIRGELALKSPISLSDIRDFVYNRYIGNFSGIPKSQAFNFIHSCLNEVFLA